MTWEETGLVLLRFGGVAPAKRSIAMNPDSPSRRSRAKTAGIAGGDDENLFDTTKTVPKHRHL